jgi:hypothetical protein
VLAAGSGQAQIKRNFFKTLDFYIGCGPTLYFGEVGGKSSQVSGIQAIFDNLDIDLWQTRASATAGLRYSLYKRFATSIELTPMIVSGNDLRSNKADSARYFTTYLAELSAHGEIYFSDRLNTYAPYLLVGVGGIAFNGQREDNKWKDGICASFTVGFGQRIPVSKGNAHSIELAYHFTGGKSADNIDGHPNGNNNDVIFTATYKYNIRLSGKPAR